MCSAGAGLRCASPLHASHEDRSEFEKRWRTTSSASHRLTIKLLLTACSLKSAQALAAPAGHAFSRQFSVGAQHGHARFLQSSLLYSYANSFLSANFAWKCGRGHQLSSLRGLSTALGDLSATRNDEVHRGYIGCTSCKSLKNCPEAFKSWRCCRTRRGKGRMSRTPDYYSSVRGEASGAFLCLRAAEFAGHLMKMTANLQFSMCD